LALQSRAVLGSLRVKRSMGNVRNTLGITACLTIPAGGCTSSGRAGQVREVGPGLYSIGVSGGVAGGLSGKEKAVFAAVDKAGERCRSKGQNSQRSGRLTATLLSGASRASQSPNDVSQVCHEETAEPPCPAEADALLSAHLLREHEEAPAQ
jgi:hypothetical protein